MDDKDVITRKLTFPLQFKPFVKLSTKGNIFDPVIDGKLTTLATMVQGVPRDQVPSYINQRDEDGRTALFFACHYNFQNIVMYLLIKGADPHIVASNGLNCFLVCAYKGHLECSIIIQQHLIHLSNKHLFDQMKLSMKKFGFKSSDVKGGCIVSLDRNLKTVQGKFQIFQSEIENLFQAHVDNLMHHYDQMMTAQDSLGRSLVHWGAMSKFTKCLKNIQYLMMFTLQLDGWDCFINVYNDVQQLEISQELRVDPRHTQKATEMAKNFLERSVQEKIIFNMLKSIKAIMKTAVNQQDNDEFTPMHLASFNGDFKAIQYFLSIGGDAHLRAIGKDVLDYAANDMVRKYMVDLKNAARKGDASSFNTLVNCGHKVDGRATIYGIGPLHHVMKHTAQSKSTVMFETIMKKDPNLNLVDSNGWTPLHHAASVGDVGSVNSLIEHGASVMRFSNKGYYPLHIAALYDKPDVIQALYDKSANLENLDDLKCTALHLAARKGHTLCVKLLFDLGCNIYAQDIQKWTALHHAGFNDHKDVVGLLCRQDGDYDKLRQMKNSREQEVFNLMPNETIRFKLETTWRSSINGQIDPLRKLLILGEDINEQTLEKKKTPLMLKAAENGHLSMVNFMLEKGADKSLKDKYNKTALDYAKQNKHTKIVQVLQEPNAK